MLDGTSRMNREVHVRICEGRGLRCPRLLGLIRGRQQARRSRMRRRTRWGSWRWWPGRIAWTTMIAFFLTVGLR